MNNPVQIYQADALSALTPLTKDHFDNFHKYRVEWMPGPNGYIAWYLGTSSAHYPH